MDVSQSQQRAVFFFDIDNCYADVLSGAHHGIVNMIVSGTKVHDLMRGLINAYFVSHLALTPEDAHQLHEQYYKDYGLAISGLVQHHKVDPLEYNRQVDDALPLDTVITPDAKLRKLLEDLDKTKVKPWLFTNAHITHGQRVVKLLGVQDMFEGITFCDYRTLPFVCKPHPEMYEKAEREAGVSSSTQCYFVDDSALNCRHAHTRGWTAIHLLDPEDPEPASKPSKYQIRTLEELRTLFPHFFNQSADDDLERAAGFTDPPTLM